MKQIIILACAAVSSMKINAQDAERKHPNIIWITCEDISPFLGAYGDNVVKTPNIDQLAKESIRYNSVYTVAGVSAPSRACFITGMYPVSIGTQHMRTLAGGEFGVAKSKTGLNYSAVIPYYIKCFPEYMRMNGYFTSNNQKNDYQFIVPVTAWDENDAAASYSDSPTDKPFFSVFNLFVTHESQIFSRNDSITVDPNIVNVPPYYKDTPIVRRDIARLMTNIQMMDVQIGELIAQLKKDGIYDDSYIFFFSDHGGALPWMKREIIERGTHIPFMIKFPKGEHAGTVNNDLISSVDFAPTVLSIAGVKIPQYMQGQAFLGDQAAKAKRKYVFAARDRIGECTERARSVRDARFRYVYNYHPELPKYHDLSYRRQIPMMQEMLQLHQEGKLDPTQEDWFKTPKAVEELYDVLNDPDELHNLASNPKYEAKLNELRKIYQDWKAQVGDMSEKDEKDMVKDMWNGGDQAPATEMASISAKNGFISITCTTKGASIGYRILKADQPSISKVSKKVHSWDFGVTTGFIKEGQEIQAEPGWSVYHNQPIKLEKGDKIVVQAHRIGYTPAIVEYIEQ